MAGSFFCLRRNKLFAKSPHPIAQNSVQFP